MVLKQEIAIFEKVWGWGVNFASCHYKEELRRANQTAKHTVSIQLILRDQTSFYGIQIGIQHDKRSPKLVLYIM